MSRLVQCLAVTLALLPFPAHAVDSAFTYQGQLTVSGAPAPGSAYDFQFTLQNGVGTTIGVPLLREDVPTVAGRFAVVLDFGHSAFDGTPRFLAIGVRPFSEIGAFTALAPSAAINAAPYALRASDAEQALAVAPSAVGSAGIANASVAAVDVNDTEIQRRVTTFCAEGQAIRGVAVAGTATCEPVRDTAGFVYGGSTATTTPNAGIAYPTGTSVVVSVPSFRNVTVGYGGTLATSADNTAAICLIRLMVDGSPFNELSIFTSGATSTVVEVQQAPSRWINLPMTAGGSHTLLLQLVRVSGVGSTCSGSDFWIDVRSR